MGFGERARWGIGTLPIVGTPTNIAYWIYSNSLPTAAALGTTYAASKYVVNPVLFKTASWMSKATGQPVTYGQVSKKIGEWKMYHTLKMLGFEEGMGKTVYRFRYDNTFRAAGAKGFGKYQLAHTGKGSMVWRPHRSVFLRSLGYGMLLYDVHHKLENDPDYFERTLGDINPFR